MEVVDEVVQNRGLGLDVDLDGAFTPDLVRNEVAAENDERFRTWLKCEDLPTNLSEVGASSD